MKPGEILFLSKNEVAKFITKDEALELTEKSLEEFALGKANNPSKLVLPCYPYHNGHINSMPSYMNYKDVAGVKVVSVYNDNPKKYGLPTTIGTIILYDPETGMPKSIMDGTLITDLRTGAVSGVNAKYLARKNSKTLAIVGAGVQGYTSMEMVLRSVSGIEEVVACDLSPERREFFNAKGREEYPNVSFSGIDDHREALRTTDIVVYATSADRPLLENAEPAKGVTVITVCELLTRRAVGKFDKWYTDFAECALERYNDGGATSAKEYGFEWQDLTMDLVTGEIGHVISGDLPGREDDDQKILAGAVGVSVEDVMCAEQVFERAVDAGAGIVLDLENM